MVLLPIGLLVNQQNTMQCTEKAAFFFRKTTKKPKKKDIHTTKSHPHPHTPHYPHTHTHKKITDAADKMKIHYEIGTMLSTNDEIMCTCVRAQYVAKAQYVTILLRIGLRMRNLTGFLKTWPNT